MLYNLSIEYGDIMKNKKGFVLTETLVVTVFLVTISTFIYVSIIPLMGRYEDLIERERDLDIVYKLHNFRKLIIEFADEDVIVNGGFNSNITCDNLNSEGYIAYCKKMLEQIDLVNYRLIYVDNIHNHLENGDIASVDEEIGTNEFSQYLEMYEKEYGEYLVLLDITKDSYTGKQRHTIAHLQYYPFIQAY